MSDTTTVVVFASQKGGSGKTTLSGHLAVEAQQQGDGPVALIDTDPQGSLAKWWNERSAQAPVFAQIELHELHDGIERLRAQGFRLIVIDTPPAVTSSIVEVVSHADLVIVPTRPSPHDLRAVGPTVDLIEYQKKPLIFVVNSATPRARITGETAVALSQHGTVAPVTIHHRVDFAASMIDGRTVGEVNADSRSAKEISALWLYLSDRIQRLKGDADVLLFGRKHSFDTEMLTPEPGSRLNVPAITTAGPEWEERVQKVDAAQLSPAVGESQDGIERRKLDQGPPLDEPERRASEPWDGVERRKVDRGLPPGMPERRQSPIFGKRGTTKAPVSDMSQKRFNA